MAKKNKIVFNKLVRDLIPETIARTGSKVVFKALKGDELKMALKRKLLEEVNELVVAETTEQIIEEMADIMEVLEQMQFVLSNRIISDQEITKVRDRKEMANGGFNEGFYLIEVEGKNDQ